jgi:hypothetical protein
MALRAAGIEETYIAPMTLSALRQQMNTEALAAGFRDTFYIIGFCFLLAMIPILFISRRYTQRHQRFAEKTGKGS